MTTATDSSPATPTEAPDKGVGCRDWLGTNDGVMFAAALRKMNVKLRKGYRHTIDISDKEAAEWPTFDHPVIEVKHEGQWMLLKMPDGPTFFKTAEERDRVFDALSNIPVCRADTKTDKL